ncbi:MAG: DUF1385 domain-containing protein [Candidatus Dormibacteraeota bacterium]|uniref:DUF1385 domain-containing protein n=1 Tax=Candidatus Dormiibacter inghamiae TaxID=3127013 RepID=A0A934N7Q3_9BACT|nr:DUF1385 domain-containing protein [Candidatus Dormibacteraeota bacterium]MBJ7605859.1 DUF1385 domain-containing protein [Candidatus Dormibacteraeota bacterium]
MALPEEPTPERISLRTSGSEPFFYGGQAVVEGVLMRGPRSYAVAVRKRNSGEIVLDQGELSGGLYIGRFWKLPFVRGLALLAEQMHLGMRSLIWSAAVSAGDQEVEIGRREIAITIAIAVAASLLLFIGLPLLGAGFAVRRAGSIGFVVVEGLIRVGLVIGYLLLIGSTRDVRRVFQYHGAEHKTINAFESGWQLEVGRLRRASLLHPRCGTGFLVVVVVVSVLVFGLVALAQPDWPELILSRLLGVPIIAGVSYECIRFMARHRSNSVVKVLLIPVLATQRLTTREPDDGMLEVALAALQAVRRAEGAAA